MNAVITLGIDMSSQPKGTAACAVTWEVDRAVTVTPCLGCDDEMLSEMIAKSDAVGIDAPFGWPAEFAVAVGAGALPRGPPSCANGPVSRRQTELCTKPWDAGP
jgi:predicted nuclease with RNAse H fold